MQFFFSKIFKLINLFLVSTVGEVAKLMFFCENFQKTFLKIFNLGKPEILKIIFVSKLKKLFIIIGIDVKR